MESNPTEEAGFFLVALIGRSPEGWPRPPVVLAVPWGAPLPAPTVPFMPVFAPALWPGARRRIVLVDAARRSALHLGRALRTAADLRVG